ncbi:MAG: DUF2391 family protein [Candidatus Nanohaloarchaea archaeon]
MIGKLAAGATERYPFGADDFIQQLIGSAILSSPLLFTEEVWMIAGNTSYIQSAATVGITAMIGHGILYVASGKRDFETERKFLGITYRYISLMTVSFGSILTILALTATAETFNAGAGQTLRVVSLLSFFSMIGAATADDLI